MVIVVQNILDGMILALGIGSLIFALLSYYKVRDEKPAFLWMVYCFALFLLARALSLLVPSSLLVTMMFLLAVFCMIIVVREMGRGKEEKLLKRRKGRKR